MKRIYTKEILDLGHHTQEEYESCLEELNRVGILLGGDRATNKALASLNFSPQSIVDVGCGGGFFTKKLSMRFPFAEVTGIDISKAAIDFATKRQPPQNNLKFIHQTMKPADLIVSTLVCHHLDDKELISFFQDIYKASKYGIIINDLHRHPMAFVLYKLIAPPLFRNRLITQDGLLSIRRSFRREDWIKVLQGAKIPLEECSITWHWPFRWIVTITKGHRG